MRDRLHLALFTVAIGFAGVATAQSTADRQRLATASVNCLDTCDRGFRQCLGIPAPGGPRTPIPDRPGGNVPTPPPYEECLLNRDICVAQCQVSLAEGRKQAADRQGRPRR